MNYKLKCMFNVNDFKKGEIIKPLRIIDEKGMKWIEIERADKTKDTLSLEGAMQIFELIKGDQI